MRTAVNKYKLCISENRILYGRTKEKIRDKAVVGQRTAAPYASEWSAPWFELIGQQVWRWIASKQCLFVFPRCAHARSTCMHHTLGILSGVKINRKLNAPKITVYWWDVHSWSRVCRCCCQNTDRKIDLCHVSAHAVIFGPPFDESCMT